MKNALGVSLGILALVWTYLALTVLSGYVLVWAGFVAWGAYFVVGGKSALADTITAMIYGSIMAGVAVVIILIYLLLPLLQWVLRFGLLPLFQNSKILLQMYLVTPQPLRSLYNRC